MPKVCIMTSAHTSRDVRIYHKQAVSLAKAGYEVILLNNHETAEDENGIRLINVGAPYSTRRERIIKSPGVFFEAALKQKADVYHIHDPELIKTAVKLRIKTGAAVIFDSHEDTPRQVLTKEYIPSAFRPICAWYMDRREKRASVKLSAIITATRHIEDVFKGYGCKKTVTINNYPLLSEYSTDRPISREKENAVCYVGGISGIRGVAEDVEAMKDCGCKFFIAGEFDSEALKKRVTALDGWKKCEHLGFISRSECSELMSRSKAGLLTYLAVPNHVEAQPNKLFEYMAAGLPVIGSDFPLWRDIILENGVCGICVDPSKPSEIADAVNYISAHGEEAYQMGCAGRKKVIEQFNWNIEEKKLLALYNELIKEKYE